MCEAVEDEITRRGGGLAFPAQSSRNEIAAHYCAVARGRDGLRERRPRQARHRRARRRLGGGHRPHRERRRSPARTGRSWRRRGPRSRPRSRRRGRAWPCAACRRPSRPRCGATACAPCRTSAATAWGGGPCTARPPSRTRPTATPTASSSGAVVAIEPFATDGKGESSSAARPRSSGSTRAGPRARRASPEVVAAMRRVQRPALRAPAALGLSAGGGGGDAARATRGRHLGAYAPLVEAQQRKVAQAEHTLISDPTEWRS